MNGPGAVDGAGVADGGRVDRYLTMRAITIQYLRMIEDELVALGGIRPQDRACMTRAERRGRLTSDERRRASEGESDVGQ